MNIEPMTPGVARRRAWCSRARARAACAGTPAGRPTPFATPAGYATEDGTGLLYAGTELLEAVTIVPGKHVWQVTPDGNGSYAGQAIIPRLITDQA